MTDIIEGDVVNLDREELVGIAKPLFYGYMFVAGLVMSESMTMSGTLMGLAGLASLTFVSAALAEGMKEDWKSFLDLISISALLLTVLFGSYTAAVIALGA